MTTNCQACGKRLRMTRHELSRTGDRVTTQPKVCKQLRGNYETCTSREFDRENLTGALGWRCVDCGYFHGDRERRKLVAVRPNGRGGYQGQGYFCSCTCGWVWAVRVLSAQNPKDQAKRRAKSIGTR
jgi:hypothetical protein